jgi:hypothetical protein
MAFKMKGFSPFHQEKESEKVTTGQIGEVRLDKGVKEALVSGALVSAGGTKKQTHKLWKPDISLMRETEGAKKAKKEIKDILK